jgi:2-polyprenyl-6-methoxyphenol hydroxylase-like FAD-dependent oxidoreductase
MANVAIHRAALQRVLLDAAGADVVHLGAECKSLTQDETGVTAWFADGRAARGDFLVGADGLHSTVRASIYRPEPPRYAGYTAWRGIANITHPQIEPDTAFEAWGRGVRFGMVPVAAGRVYWFATRNAPQGQIDLAEGRKARLMALFKDWHSPIPEILQATDEAAILHNDILDREPLKRWTEGRVTLLGDAAHPMTPNLGQGACQAIEDAVMLAQRLKEREDVEEALLSYEMRRIQRANFVVRQSWQIGRVAQWSNPVAVAVRDRLFKLVGDMVQRPQLNLLLGYDI